jgi:hypothetical protein
MQIYLQLNPLQMLSVCPEQEAVTSMSEIEFQTLGLSWQKQYEWTGTAFVEVIPPPPLPPTLEQVKSAKMQELEAAYFAELDNGYQDNFRGHDKNQGEYARLLQLEETAIIAGVKTETDTTTWLGKSGAVTDTIANYRLFMLSYGQWVARIVMHYWGYVSAIQAAQSIEAVEDISIVLGAF